MTNRPRIGVLSKGLFQGGVETLILEMLSVRDQSAFEYQIRFLDATRDDMVPQFNELGLTPQPISVWGRKEGSIWAWLHEIDLLHVHSPMPLVVAKLTRFASRTNLPIVYTEHGMRTSYNRMTQVGLRVTDRLYHCGFSVSGAVQETIPSRVRKSHTVHIHGIDRKRVAPETSSAAPLRAELEIGGGQFVVLSVANLRSEKNLERFVQAAALAKSECPAIRFLQAGDGPDAPELHRLNRELNSPVEFLGRREDIADLMALSSCLTLTSDFEGLPVVLLEARAAGLPYVGAAVGGIPEIVHDGIDGLLVESADPQMYANAWLDLRNRPERLDFLRSNSSERVLEFSAKKTQQEMEAFYRACVDADRGA